jgi:hypothetical protein
MSAHTVLKKSPEEGLLYTVRTISPYAGLVQVGRFYARPSLSQDLCKRFSPYAGLVHIIHVTRLKRSLVEPLHRTTMHVTHKKYENHLHRLMSAHAVLNKVMLESWKRAPYTMHNQYHLNVTLLHDHSGWALAQDHNACHHLQVKPDIRNNLCKNSAPPYTIRFTCTICESRY